MIRENPWEALGRSWALNKRNLLLQGDRALGGLWLSWEGWKVMSWSPVVSVHLRSLLGERAHQLSFRGISLLPFHVMLVGLPILMHAWLQGMAKRWALAQARTISVHPWDFTYRPQGRRLFPWPLRLLLFLKALLLTLFFFKDTSFMWLCGILIVARGIFYCGGRASLDEAQGLQRMQAQ